MSGEDSTIPVETKQYPAMMGSLSHFSGFKLSDDTEMVDHVQNNKGWRDGDSPRYLDRSLDLSSSETGIQKGPEVSTWKRPVRERAARETWHLLHVPVEPGAGWTGEYPCDTHESCRTVPGRAGPGPEELSGYQGERDTPVLRVRDPGGILTIFPNR